MINVYRHSKFSRASNNEPESIPEKIQSYLKIKKVRVFKYYLAKINVILIKNDSL